MLASFSPSLDVFNFFLSKKCSFSYSKCSLKQNNIFSHPSAARLITLTLHSCDIEQFNEDLFIKCINLKELSIDSKSLHIFGINSKKASLVCKSLTRLYVHTHGDQRFELPSFAKLVKQTRGTFPNVQDTQQSVVFNAA